MRRISTAVMLFVLVSGCVGYVSPAIAPMPEGRAVEIAEGFAHQHGFNPSGVRYAVYNGRRGFWKVGLWLGAPSCGAVRVNIDAFNGRAFDFVPFLRPCGGPPPKIEEDRGDL